jgi:hypothetical protein
MLLDPPCVGDRVVEVLGEDLADSRAPFGRLRHEVGQPAVVRPDSGQPVPVVVRLRRLGEQDEAREEWRHRVREDHLGDDAVLLLLTETLIAVPVAAAPVVLQFLERVLVPGPPGIEVLKKLSVEVLAVLGVTAASMRVRRDDRVVVCRGHGRTSPRNP